MNDSNGKAAIAAVSLVLAGALYLASCSIASAAPHEIRYQNPAPVAYDQIAVCRSTECVDHAVACAPGATCSLTADLPAGSHAVWLLGRSGVLTSAPSNVRTVTVVAPPTPPVNPDCARADFDGSGSVTAADFARFFAVFGQSCQQ